MTESAPKTDSKTVGTLWEIKATRTVVTRPNGVPYVVLPDPDGVCRYVLDVAGVFTADVNGKQLTVEAV